MRSTNRKYTDIPADEGGVGARQMELALVPEGGEYPDNCSISEVSIQGSKKSRRLFEELQEMHLPRIWQEVAAVTGPETFIEIWQMLDGSLEEDRRVHIPNFSRFHRYQRNELIRSLAAQDECATAIKQHLFIHGYTLSLRSIERIIQE